VTGDTLILGGIRAWIFICRFQTKEKEEKANLFLQTTNNRETVKGDDMITSGGITNKSFPVDNR
jgi:hypothetical protein